MRIGLIADTHVPEAGSSLPGDVYERLSGVDLVLHAGDMHVIDVLDWLERIAPTVACRGNGDGDGWRPPFPDNDPRVLPTQLFEYEGVRIGLVHAFPLPGEAPWTSQLSQMTRHFGGPVDVVVFGDSHVPAIVRHEGVLLINPGSPTLPRNISAPGTVAVLSIKAGIASADLIQLETLTPHTAAGMYVRR